MTAEIVNSVGLTANIAGVILAFFYGYPQPSHQEGVALRLEKGTVLSDGRKVVEHDVDVRKQKRKYFIFSHFGLALMAGGFALQLVATWIPATAPSALQLPSAAIPRASPPR
jgi:hypothetical protein